MNRSEITEMACEAGLEWDQARAGYFVHDSFQSGVSTLKRFAELVAAKEREACAKICDEMQEHWSAIKDTALLNGDVDLSNASSGEPRAAESLAALIRARGKP